MKKWIAMLLVLTSVMGLAACGNGGSKEPAGTTAPEVIPENALEVLETVWNSYADEEKFFAMGGDYTHLADNAPGVHSVEDEGMTATLLVPEDQVKYVTEAASLFHGMMLNNFVCGVFRVSGDVDAFAQAMYSAIKGHQYLCNFPDKVVVAVIGGEFVLAAYGITDNIDPFMAKFTAAYPRAVVKYNEAI
jgi:hypothetical protein